MTYEQAAEDARRLEEVAEDRRRIYVAARREWRRARYAARAAEKEAGRLSVAELRALRGAS